MCDVSSREIQTTDMSQPSIPKGTRDFGPEIMVRRNYIFSVIRRSFERFGFMPLETPSMENLDTLTGKYGEEGDQLIFKILNNGDYLKDADKAALEAGDSRKLSFSLCDRALRYDLTVPFARFVVMNKNSITFPFKRYQIQPVWRADRPQKGRYREFYQCDVDVVGSDSLLNEVELVQIFDEVLSDLKIRSAIKINNRKLLAGIAEWAGCSDRMMEMTIAIDKLDKVGEDGVVKELTEREFGSDTIEKIKAVFGIQGDVQSKMTNMRSLLSESALGQKGLDELQFIFDYVNTLGLRTAEVELDITLARGLNYYTGAIFEVKALDAAMGSICGGGRYDDLTGIFGLPGVSGVGISFGADRIYDVMNELNLFPAEATNSTKLLFANFGPEEEKFCMKILADVRRAGINAEMYPITTKKMSKQFEYADNKRIAFVAIVGSNEMASNVVSLKNMATGEQTTVGVAELVAKLG
jgi:histidyl-tRNA synthetase